MTQQMLCPVPLKTGGSRPKQTDDDVREMAVMAILPHVIRWLGNDYRDNERDEIIEDLRNATEHNEDGFDIADHLKDYAHWECDASLVDVLDGFGHDLWSAERKLTAQWVEANSIAPKYGVGEKVTVREGLTRKRGDGEITSIDLKHAKYTVYVAEWGHVRQGIGTHGSIFNYEDVEAWNA